MESSPPVRAFQQAASPTNSHYSINLDALGMDDLTELDVPQQKVERIFSEDIDGPSDFTQNMEMWMRSGKTPKGTLRGTLRGRKPATTIMQQMPEEEPVQQNDGVPDVPRRDAEDGRTESHHTPGNTPPKLPILDDNQNDDQFSSEWHNYDSATPAVPAHKQFLQPTVEEYYSELSPTRLASVRSLRQRSLLSSRSRSYQNSPNGHPVTVARASSPTLSPTRSPVSEDAEALPEDDQDQDQQQAFQAELRKLQAKCQQLQHLNNALNSALEEEKRIRKHEKVVHTSQATEMKRREKDLADNNDAAHRHNDDFQREFGALKERLREQQRQAEHAKIGRQETEQDLRGEVQRLREHLQVQGLEHHQEMKRLQQDLELARKSRTNVEEAAKEYREDAEEQRDALEADVSRLRMALQQAHVDEAAITNLERELEEVNTQFKQLKAEKKGAEAALRKQKDQVAMMKEASERESARLTAERSRAVDLASGLQRQLQELRRQSKGEQVVHEEELERLKSDRATTSHVSVKELDILRTELEAKQNELNEAILERDEAQDNLEARLSTEKELELQLQDMKAVNAALDARITEKLQKREQYWKEKLEEGDTERQLMAKALLHQWGREEIGIDTPQLYAYKYMSKSSPKSPTKPRTKVSL